MLSSCHSSSFLSVCHSNFVYLFGFLRKNAEQKVLHRSRNNMFSSCQPEPAFLIIFNNISRPQKILCCININSEYIKRKNRASVCRQIYIYLFLLHSLFFINTLMWVRFIQNTFQTKSWENCLFLSKTVSWVKFKIMVKTNYLRSSPSTPPKFSQSFYHS